MKKTIIGISLLLIAAIAGSLTYALSPEANAKHYYISPANEYDLAHTKQIENLYVFVNSTPEFENKVIGSVKVGGIVGSSKPEDLLNTLIKKCKKDYPTAQALIVYDLSFEKADVITFTEPTK